MDAFGRELNTLLVETYRSVGRIEELMLRDLSAGKLSIGEMHAIECIGRGGAKGRSATEISQEMNITLPSVTAVVKRLEKKGYVTKEKDPGDGRMVHITLTPEGRRADIAHRWFHRRMIASIREGMDESEREVLLRSMRCVNDFMRLKLKELEVEGKGELN